MTSEEFIHDRLCKVAEDFEARHREFADAAKVTEEHDIARGQVAIGAAYRKCAEAVRNAIRELASVPVDEDAPGSEPKTVIVVVERDGHPPRRFHATGWQVLPVGSEAGDLVLTVDGDEWVAQIGARQWDSVFTESAAIGDPEFTPAERLASVRAAIEQYRTTVQDVADGIASLGDDGDIDLDDDGERDTARRMDALDEAARLEAGL